MKKTLALFLTFALLLPLWAVPAAGAEDFTVEPFYALGWSNMDEEKFPNMDGLVTSQFSNIGGNATISYGGAKVVYNKNGLDDTTVTKFAQAMKNKMDARPAGMRYWHVWGPGTVLKLKPVQVIYLDYGVDQMKVMMTAILAKYKEIGGQLDGLVIDTEYYGMSSYYISQSATKDPQLYQKIVDDPHYATEVRPLLEERGFQFYPYITEKTPEIYSADQKSGSEYAQSRSIWNAVMNIRLAQYLNEWAYEPLKTFFPEASLSDYKTTAGDSWLKLMEMKPGGNYVHGGNLLQAGTASCYSFYFQNPGASFFDSYKKYASYNDAIFEGTPFNSLLYEINFAKYMYLSNDLRQIAPWITAYDYERFDDMDTSVTIINTHYYAEQIYHLGMLDPEPFLAYIYSPSYKDENGNVSKDIFDEKCSVLQELLAELTRVAGFSDRKPIEIPPYWNSEFILSGMYAGGRNIWRITPSGEISLEDFLIDGADPTFSVKGQTITFPGGKILADTTISTVGSYGYWVETPADVTPIVVSDTDRYEKYPSLLFDFEDMSVGAFNRSSHSPKDTWDFSGTGAAAIEKIGNDQVLTLRGDITLYSKKLPGNITAGDSYAEDQCWQVTLTIPEGLPADAEITLLAYYSSSQSAADEGFKIAGGKVYYSTGTTAQEFKELCAITPGTYVLERTMDLNDPADFKSTYTLYKSDGTKLASSGKVSIPTYTTIGSIRFGARNLEQAAVQLDDYKIFLTGLTTDFMLFDAQLGMPISAQDTPRDRSTAYRLSWLNATDKEVAAGVMAAIYRGETLVEEKVVKLITMAPGCDGVDTGEVALEDGQTLKVYLKTGDKTDFDSYFPQPTDPTEPTEPSAPTEPTEPGNRQKGSNVILPAAIACGVIILVAVVAMLLPAKKKTTDK